MNQEIAAWVGDIEGKISNTHQQLQHITAEINQLKNLALPPNTDSNPNLNPNSNSNPHVITINVGGKTYVTSLTTLQHAEYFVSMFNGSFRAATLVNGNYFIDRDPILFGIILAFLRSRNFPFVATKHEKKEVLEEAKFYGVEPLATFIAYALLEPGVTIHQTKDSLIYYWKLPSFSKLVFEKKEDRQISEVDGAGELRQVFLYQNIEIHFCLTFPWQKIQYQLFHVGEGVEHIIDLISIVTIIDQYNPANSKYKTDDELYWHVTKSKQLIATDELCDSSLGFLVDDHVIFRIEFRDVPELQKRNKTL